MNIEDARRIYIEAKKEKEALAEEKYKELIKNTDKSIKKSASEGNSRCGVLCITLFRDRFISHYKKKGFKVSNIVNAVTIDWELEEPNEEWLSFTHYSTQRVGYEIYSKRQFHEIAECYRNFQLVFTSNEEKMIDILILLKEIHGALGRSFHFKVTGQEDTKKVVDFLQAMGYEATYYIVTSARSPRCEEFLITVSKGWLD